MPPSEYLKYSSESVTYVTSYAYREGVWENTFPTHSEMTRLNGSSIVYR